MFSPVLPGDFVQIPASGGRNPFNQSLNTTDSPSFAGLTVNGLPITGPPFNLNSGDVLASHNTGGISVDMNGNFQILNQEEAQVFGIDINGYAYLSIVGAGSIIGFDSNQYPVIQTNNGNGLSFDSSRNPMINTSGVFTMPGLPTSDPGVSGRWWNNLGIVSVSI